VLWLRWSVACRVKKSRVSEAAALSIRVGPLILPQVPEPCGPYRSGRSHVEKSSTWYSDSYRRRKAARHGNGVHVVAAMARRDKIVACFDELIKEKGEKAVLYRKSVKTAMKPPWLPLAAGLETPGDNYSSLGGGAGGPASSLKRFTRYAIAASLPLV
jgi:hypothetical protein